MVTKELKEPGQKQNGKKYFALLYSKSKDKLVLLTLLITLFSASCRKECIDNDKQNQHLVSSTKIGDFTKEQLDARFNDKSELSYLSQLDQYNISVYKIVYKTKFINDLDIQASGCIIIPQSSPTPAMISMQHGDILAAENLAPSYYVPGPATATTAYNEGSAEAPHSILLLLQENLSTSDNKEKRKC